MKMTVQRVWRFIDPFDWIVDQIVEELGNIEGRCEASGECQVGGMSKFQVRPWRQRNQWTSPVTCYSIACSHTKRALARSVVPNILSLKESSNLNLMESSDPLKILCLSTQKVFVSYIYDCNHFQNSDLRTFLPTHPHHNFGEKSLLCLHHLIFVKLKPQSISPVCNNEN